MSILVSLALAFTVTHAEAGITPEATGATATDISNSASSDDVATEPVTPAPEAPEGLHVAVKDGLLSVSILDQTFGDVIASVANAAVFDVDLSNDVFEMRLSTRFNKVELERGILRLLHLIDQRNYSIDYKPDGKIKRLEVYGDLSSGTRTISGSQPIKTTAPSTSGRSTKAPPTPPTLVIKDAERERKRLRDTSAAEGEQPATEQAKEPEEPTEEEEILEMDFIFKETPGGEQAEEPAAEPEAPTEEAPTEGVIEEEIIPEGDIPPDDQLLDAPFCPEGGPCL
jgi:hypothetical protein